MRNEEKNKGRTKKEGITIHLCKENKYSDRRNKQRYAFKSQTSTL